LSMTPPAPGMRSELSQVDRDRDGVIDDYELIGLRSKVVKLSSSDNMMEILSTHPNMLKRMKHVLVDGLRKLGGSSYWI